MKHLAPTKIKLTLLAAGLLTVAAAAAGETGDTATTWRTVADEGPWMLKSGEQIDLSRGWKVIEHGKTGRVRVVPKAFGTEGLTIAHFPFDSFTPSTDTSSWGGNATSGYHWRLGGPNEFVAAGMQVPSGMRIVQIELEACDQSASEELRIEMESCTAFGSVCTTVIGVSTGVSETPGCGFFSAVDSPGHLVDNFSNTYFIGAITSATSNDIRMRSLRVYLQREISPAPASATFGDVPTDHPFFQHVEAVADSGITAGCGGGDYCPDAALTRGQMAVFLAKALGLHWPDE